jgi:hypothetical protein
MNMPWFKVLFTLVRREIREQRWLFVYLPIAFSLLAFTVFTLWLVQTEGPPESLRRFLEDLPNRPLPPELTPEELQEMMTRVQAMVDDYHTNATTTLNRMAEGLMLLAFWASMAFYYLNTLYQPRKDRSILFWNSLPVSDTQTIASKLLAGLVACHAVYMLCFAALDLSILLAVRTWVSVSGVEGFASYMSGDQQFVREVASAGERSVRVGDPVEVGPFINSMYYLAKMPLSLLWCLPAYGWLLLASACAKEAPFAVAAGPVVAAVVVEVLVREKSWVFNKVAEHLLPTEFVALDPSYATPELVVSAVLGAVLIYAAIRFNRSDAN